LLLLGCEQEAITPSPQNDPAAAVVESKGLPEISASELEIELKEGIPFYANAETFSQAVFTLTRISSSDYLEWAAARNLTTGYHSFLEAMDRAETEGYQFQKSDLDYILPLDEGGAVQNPYFLYARLVSPEGYAYVGSDIHYFSGRKHVLVDEGDLSAIETARNQTGTVEGEGIYVWNRDVSISSDVFGLHENNHQKVQVESFGCPGVLGRSDQFGIVETWWQRLGVNGALTRQDEQRVGCSRRRCREATWGVFATTIDVIEVNSLNYRYIGGISYAFDNRERNRFNWTRTFPNVLISGKLFGGNDKTEFTHNTLENQPGNAANAVVRVLSTRVITPPAEFVGTAQENVLISPGFIATAPYRFANGSLNSVFGFIRVEGGSVSHKWTNRGNNPTNDPIGTEFRCQ